MPVRVRSASASPWRWSKAPCSAHGYRLGRRWLLLLDGASSNGRTLVFGASYAGSIPAAPTTRWCVISPLLNRSTGSGTTRERRGRSTLGCRPTAGLWPLMPAIGVQIPAPEPMHRDATGSRLPCLGSETGSSPVRCAMSVSSSWLGHRPLKSETAGSTPRTDAMEINAGWARRRLEPGWTRKR